MKFLATAVITLGLVFGTAAVADAKPAKRHHHHKPLLSQVKPGNGGSCARVATNYTGNACDLATAQPFLR